MRAEAQNLRQRAASLLSEVPTWAPEADKIEGWALEERASELEVEASLGEVARLQELAAALNLSCRRSIQACCRAI